MLVDRERFLSDNTEKLVVNLILRKHALCVRGKAMENSVRSTPIEAAESGLVRLLAQLRLGETITLIGADGMPEALLVSLKAATSKQMPLRDWQVQWDALTHKVDRAWTSDKSAVEILSEMRR